MTVRTAMELPMASLYVGDLHPDVTEGLLYEKFSAIGQVVSAKICRDSTTNQSLGYAYVNFSYYADAEKALDTMNFDVLKGRAMRIMWSQRDPSLRRSGVGNIFIKNLDKSIDNKAMYDTFSAFGNILSCKVVVDEDAISKGFGFVHFERAEVAKKAIEKVNGMLLNGKKVYVGQFIPRVEREKLKNVFTNIFIKNFGRNFTEENLYNLFSKFGTISSCVVMKNPDGSSKGFGFVDYENHKSAEEAVKEMNNFQLEGGNTLYVSRAQKKTEREMELRRKFEQMKSDRYNQVQGTNIYVKHLDDSIDDEKLRKEFSLFGNITSAKVMLADSGRSKGFGFVCFSSSEEANEAITKMNGRIVGTKPLYVGLAQRKDERKAYLNNLCAQRLRYQTITFPTIPPFLIPTVTQGPRFFNHVNQTRSTQRWPVQPPLRFNDTFMPPIPPPLYRPVFKQSFQVTNRNSVQPRPITGQQILTRPNSRYTTNSNMVRSVNMASGNGSSNNNNNTTNSTTNNNNGNSETSILEEKQILGERMYRVIEKIYPEIAGKITGMLLEIEITQLKDLISDQESLRSKVEEAVAVLQAYQSSKGDAVRS